MKNCHISIVVPVFGCCESLSELCRRIIDAVEKITNDLEIILVNDASPDNAWLEIHEQASLDARIRGINLTRNFGQHHAISAGLDYARGEWVVVMDCDLQDQPEDIVLLYEKVCTGYDVVFGRRSTRKDTWLKKWSSKLFHRVFNYLTDINKDDTIANFCIFSRDVLKEIKLLKEKYRNHYLFISWIGYRQTSIDVNHAERQFGKSSYTYKKLINFAIDTIVSQSNKPLRISIKVGFFMSLLSLLYAVLLILRYFVYATPVPGWTSVMVSIYFVGGLILGSIGFIGIYIGKIFDESKDRPIYVVKETINF